MENFTSLESLERAIDIICQSPSLEGLVKEIVIRPEENERKVVESCEVSIAEGVVGDNWKRRGYKGSEDGSASLAMQINIMNSRVINAIAGEHLSKPLAGDQFFVDFDLSKTNLPAGSRISVGSAELEVTSEPHLGCLKFANRFGQDAVKFVNSDAGKALNLRGINAKVVVAGSVQTGSSIKKLS